MRLFFLQGIVFTSFTTCIRSQTVPSAARTVSITQAGIPCNPERYVEWSELSEDMISNAKALGYNEVLWDTPRATGTSVESHNWGWLGYKKKYAENLGFNELSWNCYMNHYYDYTWDSIKFYDLDDSMITLGWGESCFDRGICKEQKKWSDLTDKERAAAKTICHTRGSWDEHILLWYIDKCGSFTRSCNPERYVEWSELSEDMIRNAKALGYNEVLWDNPTVQATDTSVESYKWTGLGDKQRYAENLGFHRLSWDCYMNHYDDYTWNQLKFYGLDDSMIALGWSESCWEGGWCIVNTKWSYLTDKERAAAEYICYTPASWEKLHLWFYRTKCGSFTHSSQS